MKWNKKKYKGWKWR